MANAFLMGILCFYVVFRVAHMTKTKDPILGVILVAVALSRIAIGLVNHYLGPLPGAQIDAIMFAETARNMAATPTGVMNFLIDAGTYGYSSILAVFYLLGGYHYFTPTLVNLIFTVEFVIIVYSIGKDWGSPSAGRMAAACAAFYPTSLIYTSVALREAPLLWCFALFVRALLDYYDGRARLFSPRLVTALVLVVWLHDGFALAIFLIPIAMWFKHRNVPVWRRAMFMGLGMLVMLTVFVVALSFIDFRKMPADPAMLLDPEYLSRLREVKSAYGVGYGAVDGTWAGIIRSWPFLVFAFISAPFPIWWEGAGELPKVGEGLLSLSLVVLACVSVFSSPGLSLPRRRLFLSMYLYMIIVFAMGTGNTGIAARHRAKFVWMPITLVSVAYFASTARKDDPLEVIPANLVAGSGP